MLIAEADPLAAAAAPHVTAAGSLVCALKHNHAPFFPPENAICPPATNVIGDADTVTAPAEATSAVFEVTDEALSESVEQ